MVQSKTSTWSVVNFKETCDLDEPAIWSGDTGRRIPCFDRRQLIITRMSNIKELHGKPKLHVSVNSLFAAMSCDSVITIAVVRTRPRKIPLAMITMRKSTHGFPFLSYMSVGLCYHISRSV